MRSRCRHEKLTKIKRNISPIKNLIKNCPKPCWCNARREKKTFLINLPNGSITFSESLRAGKCFLLDMLKPSTGREENEKKNARKAKMRNENKKESRADIPRSNVNKTHKDHHFFSSKSNYFWTFFVWEGEKKEVVISLGWKCWDNAEILKQRDFELICHLRMSFAGLTA